MTEEARELNEQEPEEMHAVDQMVARLIEPFDRQHVNWRVVATTKDKERALVVPYMDARMVMERLDAVVGPENWNTEGKFGEDGRTMCTLSVRVQNRWMTRTGVSGFLPSELERRRNMGWSDLAKGAWSEAFKIAASSLGSGRYLYNEEQQWVSYDPDRKQITDDALEALGGGGRYELDDHEEEATPRDESVQQSSAGSGRKPEAPTGTSRAAERRQAKQGPGTHRADGTPRTAGSSANANRPISDKQRRVMWGMSFGVVTARYGVANADDLDKDKRFEVMNELCDEFEIDKITELPAGKFDAAKAFLEELKSASEPMKEETPAPPEDELPPVDDYDDMPPF